MSLISVGYDALTLHHAKSLRRDMTDAEHRLWRMLRAKRFGEFKFRRQQPIGAYIVDFVCQSARLIVEADGSQHADSAYDERRTAWLGERGYRVLRFWNSDILLRTSWVMDVVFAALASPPSCAPSLSHAPSPSHAEVGAGPSLSLKGRGEEGIEHGI